LDVGGDLGADSGLRHRGHVERVAVGALTPPTPAGVRLVLVETAVLDELVLGGDLLGDVAHAATSLMTGWVAKTAASAAVRASCAACAVWMACQMAGAWWRPYWRMSSVAAAWRIWGMVRSITVAHLPGGRWRGRGVLGGTCGLGCRACRRPVRVPARLPRPRWAARRGAPAPRRP